MVFLKLLEWVVLLSLMVTILFRQCDYNVHAEVSKQLLPRRSEQSKARIDVSLAQEICMSFKIFVIENKVQISLTKPKLNEHSVLPPLMEEPYCRDLQWQTCDLCRKFSYVRCKRSQIRNTLYKNNRKQASSNTRIVGGNDAKPNQHPYLVRLESEIDDFRYDLRCSGVIYNSMYILTSATCLDDVQPCNVYVIAGDYRVNFDDGTEQERRVVTIIKHEQYDYSYHVPFNDIALLKLGLPLNFTKSVQPILIATKEYPTNKVTFAEISGWGRLGPKLPYSETLQTITIPFVDDCDCTLYYAVYDFNFFNRKKICTGSWQRGYCKGDAGSPVTVTDSGLKYLVGIASYYGHCGNTQDPGLSTKVFAFRDWIALRAG